MNNIYALLCPISNQVYIGQTIDPAARFKRHLQCRDSVKVGNWIKSLTSIDMNPEMKILDKTESEELSNSLEKQWIQFFLNNHYEVLNVQSGGKDRYFILNHVPSKGRQPKQRVKKPPRRTTEELRRQVYSKNK